MKSRVHAVIVLMSCTCAFQVSADAVLDQQNLDNVLGLASVGESGSIGATRGQSFTVGLDGALNRIELSLADPFGSPNTDPVIVKLVTGVQPSSAPAAATALIAFASIPKVNPAYIAADFSSS